MDRRAEVRGWAHTGNRLSATAALVAATAIWGSSFVVTKGSLDDLAPAAFLAWRFGVAAAILVSVAPARILRLNRHERRRAGLLGVLLAAGFLLQTVGLQSTPAGVSGFLTGTAVMLTPVVAALFFEQRVGWTGWLAVGVCGAGLGALSRGDVGTWSTGVWFTIGGAACFAGHIACLSQWATRSNAYGITGLSVTVAAMVCAAVGLSVGQLALPATQEAWRSIGYLALAATCLGFVVQAWAQSALTATTAAVVMTLEPVFAALIAVGFGAEQMTPLGWLGGLLVVGSMFIAELGPRECCDALSPRVECC
jgi:drug/metabolite transporter (DMT)-like permease